MPHLCHAEGCTVEVPPRMFTCKQHWGRLPKPFQSLIWQYYRPGQEIDKHPSDAYMAVQQVSVGILALLEGRAEAAQRCFQTAQVFLSDLPEIQRLLRDAYARARKDHPQLRRSADQPSEKTGAGLDILDQPAPTPRTVPRLFRQDMLVVDSETTGLTRDSWARPIEVGAVHLNAYGEEAGTWSSLVHTDQLPPQADIALEINGITRAEIAAAPALPLVLSSYLAWSRGRSFQAAISFNRAFDEAMLRRIEWPVVRWSSKCIMLQACEVMSADPKCGLRRMKSGRVKWPKLGEAAAYFGVETEDVGPAHRALSDARVAGRVMREISRRMLGLKGPSEGA